MRAVGHNTLFLVLPSPGTKALWLYFGLRSVVVQRHCQSLLGGIILRSYRASGSRLAFVR